MTIHLSIVMWLPARGGLVALVMPRALARWVMLLGALLTLAYAIVIAADYDTAQRGPAVRHRRGRGSRRSGSTTSSASPGSTSSCC